MVMLMLLLPLCLHYCLGHSKTCSVDPTSHLVKNAALNKPAKQISTYTTGTASKAVDGDKTPRYSDGSCTHTLWKVGLPLYQWWMVDLEKEYKLDSVSITNRLNCAERQRDFDIFVSLNSTFEDDDHMTDERLCIHVSGGMGRGETRTFTCQTPVFGQFIQIYMETLDGRDMNICEVTVEGYVAVCIEDITTETSPTTTNTSTVITTPTATSTVLSTTIETTPTTTSASSTIPTKSVWLSTTTRTTPKTTPAVAATTPTKTTTTETWERTRTTSTSASTTTETTLSSSTIPTTTAKTTTATTIWKITSPWPVPTTSKPVATTTSVTTSTSMTLSALVSLPGNTTTVSTSTCPCVCIFSSDTTNLTQEARLELVKELRKELTVDKKETSISKRKLISAGDERQSAETIGFIGVLALCVPVLLIVSFDLINLWSSAKQTKTRVMAK